MSASVLLIGNFLSGSLRNRSVCEDLAVRLRKLGWAVFTASATPGRVGRLVDMVHTAWHHRRGYAVAQVDVFSGPAFFWAEVVCWILRRAGKPYVLTLHGGNLPSFAQRWPTRITHLLRSATVVTTPSAYLLQQMRAYRQDMCLLPNPIDLSRYKFRLRVQPRPHLIWLRAFHEIYNPALAPRVVQLLAAEFPDVRLLMVGPDKRDGSLRRTQKLAESLGVANRIRFSGGVHKEDVPRWLNKGDIFLNTTNIENAPVSVLEAMACGLCVVSTNAGGIPYFLEQEQDGMLVPCEDPDAMAAAVGRILTKPGLAEKISRNARCRAELSDWSSILPQWESLLMGLAENGVSI